MNKIKTLLLWIGLLFAIPVFAQGFVVKQIQVTGFQKIKESTIISYLPIHIGQTVTDKDTVNMLRALYKTGFFSDVQLSRSNNTLIVHVTERPTIGLIILNGNKEFTDKQLFPVLKDLGISEGSPFDDSKLNTITQGLREQYQELGYYAVEINTQVTPEPRNRVELTIRIKEGPIAKIKSLHLAGNQIYREKILLKNFLLVPTAWWRLSFLSKNDRYSKTQLSKDLEALRKFYLDRGYLHFQVTDQQIIISPDNKSVSILIRITEGPQYTIGGVELHGLSAEYVVDEPVVRRLIVIKPGDIFSRQRILNASERIRIYFANRGHAFPLINSEPRIDEEKHLVFLNYSVDPGPRSYVRRIDFTGNSVTMDTALRNRLLQMEASPYSLVDVETSKQKLAFLPYLSDVTVDTVPVSDKPDEVDLTYHVKEVNAGKASIQGGYSTSDGFIYGASLSEPNLFGTGKFGSLSFNASQFQKSYSFNYVNPYYTTYGVSRGITVFSTVTTPSSALNLVNYTMDGYGFAVTYGIPVSLNNRISFGYGYTYINIHGTNGEDNSPNITDFLHEHKPPYNQVKLTSSWIYNTLDRSDAPTRGISQLLGVELGVPIVSSSLSYYKFSEDFRYYYPLGYGFILNPHTSLGYGNGYGNVNTLPFFLNYYGGGPDSLPGYAPNSLGPKNPLDTDQSLGGNLKILGGMNFIFPNFTSKIRTAVTFDAGNIYQTVHIDGGEGPDQIGYESVDFKTLRMAVGLAAIWYSPMGPLEFSASQAINNKASDHLEWFGFAFGGSI